MKLDLRKINKEIKDKYQIHDNAFDLDVIKNPEKDRLGEVKDDVRAIIGDDKVPDTFIPQLKLARWENETNFSIRLKDTEEGEESLSSLQNKIKWSKGNIDIEFYDFEEDEGGYKLVWFLKEKPKTNKVEFTIQSKGLKFYYQPELTQKEKDEGASQPENVIGSYAVYHDTKGGLNDSGGKDYKVGKAFHIYRPKIIDAEGKETWGILHIENGIYSVEIPQDFLDTAVYPIKSNDTFGYTTEGTSFSGIATYGPYRGQFTSSGAGTITALDAYVSNANANFQGLTTGAIYSGNNVIANGKSSEYSSAYTTAPYWRTSGFSVNPTISAATYWLALSGDATVAKFYFDATVGTHGNDTTAYDTFPDPWADDSSGTRTFSIYATYTPGAAGTNIKINISDTWKDVSEIKINISDVWKSVAGASANIGDVWKKVF